MKTIWFNTEEEHRRLYAITLNDGKLTCFLDRNCVFEFSPFKDTVYPLLKPDDILTITISAGLKGLHFIYTEKGGCWAGYLLRRGYTPEEKARHIPKESDEATPELPSLETGKIRDRLVLKSKPENKKPASFKFGRKEYFVPSGKAWDWVENVILQNGFEGHPIETGSPSDYFKREARAFFTDLIKCVENKKYYIRTK